MNDEVFSVFDACARRYLEPFFSETIETAMRAFKEICNTDGHQFKRHAEDYILYHLGVFDAETGEIETFQPPHKLALAVSMIEGVQLDIDDQLREQA